MKKMKWTILVAAVAVIVLGGCSSKGKDEGKKTPATSSSTEEKVKALSPQEFGQAFADEIIYNKNSKELEKELPNFENNKKDYSDIGILFAHSFAAGIIEDGDEKEIEEKGDALGKVYTEVIEKNTKIEVKSAEDSGAKRTVVYNVYGIDFEKTADKYVSNLMKAAAALDEGDDEAQLVLEAYQKAVQESPAKEKPVEVTVTFTKKDDNWKLADTDGFSDLVLGLYLGEVDEAKFDEILEKAFARFE